jgi:hypothetical protein
LFGKRDLGLLCYKRPRLLLIAGEHMCDHVREASIGTQTIRIRAAGG